MNIGIISIVGTRPQFIKAAAVSRAIVGHNRTCANHTIAEKILHTGQHYDGYMSKVFFDELEIPWPDYNLCVGSASHGAQTGRMLERIEQVLVTETPACIVVYGDTNSTLAGALAAAKLHIPIVHVEAGLRSFNRSMPEEINRILIDHASTLLLCPTQTAIDNLANEGISEGVHLVGDVMHDCSVYYTGKAKAVEQETLERLDVQTKSYYLATVHRAENADNRSRLQVIFNALRQISSQECPVVLPLHPRTRKKIAESNVVPGKHVKLVRPVSYLEMMSLELNACAILTDSGGIQKEAYWFQVPCITLRNESEWPETVDSGWNALVGADHKMIVEAVEQAGKHTTRCNTLIHEDGHSAEQICEIIVESFGGSPRAEAVQKRIPS